MTLNWKKADEDGLKIALQEARIGFEQNGIPIGGCLIVLDEQEPNGYKVLGLGHNERIQRSSPILHGEISTLENAGRLKADIYRKATLVSVLYVSALLVWF